MRYTRTLSTTGRVELSTPQKTEAQRQIEELVAPLRTTLAAFDAKAAELEAELASVKESRRQVKRMLDLADGTTGKPGPKKNYPKGRVAGAGAANVRTLGEWLQDNRDEVARRWPDGFIARDMYEAKAEHGVDRSMPSFNVYLLELANQGVIRLDHVLNNAKFYKLT